jgi:hypothetical protein
MRSQQRSFVVEIKSKGRRSAIRQGSIWGATDLKAVARQAANVAPQLFEATDDVAETVDVVLSRPHDAPVPAGLTLADQHDSSDGVEIVSVEPIETETAPTEAVSLSVPTDAKRKPKSDAPRRAKKPSRVKPAVSQADAPQRLNASDATEDNDLVLLEAENVRLRLLWAERLRGENRQLHVMLERVQSA